MSTIRANKLEHISTSNGGIQLDNAGHVQVDGVQMPTAGPLSNRNLIINGAMKIAQRGTSSTANDYGSVDRWFVQNNGGTTTHTQTAITSGAPYDEGFRYVLRTTNTAATTGAGDYRSPFQHIEAQNLAQSGWNYTSSTSYVTLSFWVRSSVAQEFFGYLRTFDGTGQAYSFSYGTLSANTWTKVTKTIPGNSNITINNDNGTGLQVNLSAFWGTNFTDSGNTTDTWAAFSGSSRTPDYTNTWANTTGATFDITGVQLEVGEKATPFEHKSFNQELDECLRYYEKSYDYGTDPGTATVAGMLAHRKSSNTSSITDFNLMYRHKRATPTIVMYNPDNGNSGVISNNGNNATAAGTDIGQNNSRVTTTSLLGADLFLRCHYTADAEL